MVGIICPLIGIWRCIYSVTTVLLGLATCSVPCSPSCDLLWTQYACLTRNFLDALILSKGTSIINIGSNSFFMDLLYEPLEEPFRRVVGYGWSLMPGICVKYFFSFPQKNLSPEKTEKNYVFTFQFLNDKIYSYIKKSHFALSNLAKLVLWSMLSFKNWKVNT